MLKCLNLPNGFSHASPHRCRQDLHRLKDPIRVDDIATTQILSPALIIDAIQHANLSTSIRSHAKGDAAFDHPGYFIVIPDLVDIKIINAEGYDLHTQLLHFRISAGQLRQLGPADEGKIAGMEIEHDPFANKIRKFRCLEFPLKINRGFELGGFLPDICHHHD